MHIRHKRLQGKNVIALVAMAVFVLSSGALAQKPFEGKVVNVVALPSGNMNAIREKTYLFEERTGAKVVYHPYPHMGMYPKIMMELIGRTGAFDLVTGINAIQPLFEPFLISLNEFIARDFGSVEDYRNRIYPLAVEHNTYDGKIKFIPWHMATQSIAYRKALFEDPAEKEAFKAAYGYELRVPRTWQELIDVGKFFTRPEQDLWGFGIWGKGPPGGWNIISSLLGSGYNLVDLKTKSAPFSKGKDREKAIEIAKRWQDMVFKYKIAPLGSAEIGHAEAFELYIGGHFAMSYGWWTDYWGPLRSSEVVAKIGETGSTRLPNEPGKGVYISQWGYGICKDSDDPELAWEYIKFLIDKEVQLYMCEKSGSASPVIEYNEEAIRKGWLPEAMVSELKEGSQTLRHVLGWNIINLYWTYSSALFSGDLSAKEYVDTIIKKTEEVLE